MSTTFWLLQFLPSMVGAFVMACLAIWAVLKTFAPAWVEGRMADQLERFKAERTAELQVLEQRHGLAMAELGVRLQSQLDRATRLHQHEFEVLPTLWDKLIRAVSETRRLISPAYRAPRVDHMGEGELDALLATLQLPDWEAFQVRGTPVGQRDEALAVKVFWLDQRQAEAAQRDFHNFFISQGVFIQPALREAIRALSNQNDDLLKRRGVSGGVSASSDDEEANLMARVNNVQDLLHARLWDSARLAQTSSLD